MRKVKRTHWWFSRQPVFILAVILLGASLLGTVMTRAVANDGISSPPAWSSPQAMAIKQANLLGRDQTEPNFLSNMDCGLVSYRVTVNGTQQTGCFSDAAFGLVDVDSDMAIFNGTDEALQLIPYSAHEALVPWPGTLDVLALDAASTGGSYVSLYRDLLGSLHDQRNSLGQLTGKQLTKPPDAPVLDPAGHQLIINPQTIAFSSGGGWMVAETLSGSFVRINLSSLDVVPFAPSYGSSGSPGLLNSQVAVSDDGHYVAIESNAAPEFKVYDLTACTAALSGTAKALPPQNCRSYDYWPFARQQISGLQRIQHVRFLNGGLLGFEAVTSSNLSGGTYVLAPTASITSLADYVGLGDSYTSGEGSFDYLSGTDTPDDMCHLSTRSYPLLLTHDLFSSAGGHSVACSGAVIRDVGSTSQDYRGQVRGVPSLKQLEESQPDLLATIQSNFIPGYIAQHRFVGQYQPAIATVSVGGDDIGFGDIMESCVEPHVSLHDSDSTCFNTYEDRLEVLQQIDRTVPKWTALYKQLHAESPNTRLYAVGYPQVAYDAGDCAVNVHLSKSELEFSNELVTYLDVAIAEAAQKANIAYVDISQALVGHRLCEAPSYDVAINGLTAGTDAGPLDLKIFGKESYHPNALGQLLIEQAILRQTHNLTDGLAASAGSPPNSGNQLLNAPRTGRKINTRVSDGSLTSRRVNRGKSTKLTANGVKNGLSPHKTYAIHLDSPIGPTLGNSVSDDDGNLSVDLTIPVNTAPGGHTIDIAGDNQSGDSTDVTQPIFIGAEDTDADGDGIADTIDSCPGAVNSGQDADKDGIDDACDGVIGSPPTSSGQGGSTNYASSGTGADSINQDMGTEVLQPAASSGTQDSVGPPPMIQIPTEVTASGLLRVRPAISGRAMTVRAASANAPRLNRTIPSGKSSVKPGVLPPINPSVINPLPWLLIPLISLLLLLLLGLCLDMIMKRTNSQTGYA